MATENVSALISKVVSSTIGISTEAGVGGEEGEMVYTSSTAGTVKSVVSEREGGRERERERSREGGRER